MLDLLYEFLGLKDQVAARLAPESDITLVNFFEGLDNRNI